MELLESIMTTESRMWGFQICKDEQQGYMTMFRIETAKDYGTEEFQDMTPGGPGITGCRRYKLADAKVDLVSKITVHLN